MNYENADGRTVLLFYSYGGSTKRLAIIIAAERHADLFEIRELKKRGIISAFFRGCPDAMAQRSVPLSGQFPDLSGYDRAIVACPVWSGFPAPAFNSIIRSLPQGMPVEVILVSGGGETPKCKDKVRALIESMGCTCVSITDKLG